MPRVTVVVPAYNRAAFLRDALESVLRQTYRDWQVVLVDDGSTDRTPDIVAALMPAFRTRLRYLYQHNQGTSAARNTAIAASDSEFIALLDSDDVWLERRLELGVTTLDDRPEVGLVHAQVLRMDANGRVLGKPSLPAERYLQGTISRHIYARRAHILAPTVLFRRRCLDLAGHFDVSLRATEDRDLWFRIARFFDIAYLNQVVAHYRISPESMSSDWETLGRAQIQFLEKHFRAGNASLREYRQGLANLHRERGDVVFNRGRLAEAIRWYAKAVSYDVRNYRNVYMLLRALGEPVLAIARRTAQPAESKA